MATKKMKLKYAYRAGGDDLLEEIYGIRFNNKEDKNVHRQIEKVLIEHEETFKNLTEEEKEENVEEKMEYLETLDISQLRTMAKAIGLSHKTLMKMKKQEIVAELLR